MVTVSSSLVVDAAPRAVFAYLSNPDNQAEWTPNFLGLEEGPDRPPGVGMRYRGRLKAFGSVNFVVDDFVANEMFRVKTDPRVGVLTHRFTVAPDGDRCRISHVVELEPRGVFRLTAPALGVLLRRMVGDLDKQMATVIGRSAHAG
jgi:uncharacterized protein YndB with AHSA1/START domain